MQNLFIHHARLLSFHEGFEAGNDSLLIENGRIKAIGRYLEMQGLAQGNAISMDARGSTLLPGFNDTHIHIWKVGNLKTYMLDLRPAKSLEHMQALLSDYHKKFPDAQWITARGFNEATWETGKMPSKEDLDLVTRDKPMYVIHTSAHRAAVNSKALEIAGVTKDTKVPEGGEIQTGADGKPNGVFSETAMGLITNHMPAYSKEELKTMIAAARDEMYRYGITSATDPAVDPVLLEAYHEMNRDQLLGFRLNAIPVLLPDGSEQPFAIPAYFDSSFFRVNTVKFFSDGGLSSGTAALKRTYKNSMEQGILRLQKKQYLALCRASMENGLGIATHAIGDAAIDFVIESYKELQRSFPGILNRIEHLGLPDEKNLDDMSIYGIAASMQTIFIHELGRNFIKYLDEEYLNRCYPVRSVLQKGILLALSSDAPVVQDFNPFKGMEAAITRKDSDGNIIAIKEAITISEALKAYTVDAARISHTADSGSLQEGRFADLVLLNKNPLTTLPGDLTQIKVEKTFVGGKLVWEA